MTSVFPYGSIVPGFDGYSIGAGEFYTNLTITNTLTVDEITEYTPGAGVGFPTRIRVDQIDEYTLDNGVVLEEMRIRADVLTTPVMDIVSQVLTGAAADISWAIVTKGEGAILADVPDDTDVGGNIRGRNAIDLQMERNNADEVASGEFSNILGGSRNQCAGDDSSVLGGTDNYVTAGSSWNVILGGLSNIIDGAGGSNVLGGGEDNAILTGADLSFIGCGGLNVIQTGGNYNAIVAGQLGVITNGFFCFIGAGLDNECSSTTAGIVSGSSNLISNFGTDGFIGAGSDNIVQEAWGAIPGGRDNEVSGRYGFAMGRRSKALLDGCWTISDSQNGDFSSTLQDQYNSRYAGGYRIMGGKFGFNDRTSHYTEGSAQTVGAVTANIFTIPTTTDTAYTYSLHIVAATAAGDTASFQETARVKNVAGVVTASAGFNSGSDLDAAIATAVVDFVASGTDILVQATGVAAQTIEWRGMIIETMYTFV